MDQSLSSFLSNFSLMLNVCRGALSDLNIPPLFHALRVPVHENTVLATVLLQKVCKYSKLYQFIEYILKLLIVINSYKFTADGALKGK